MRIRAAFGFARLAVALTCMVALTARFAWGLGSATFTPANFFAYLTVQSNVAFLAVSVIGGLFALRSPRDPAWLTTVRAAVLSCTISSGVVYGFLIQQAGMRSFRIDVPWSDQILHFWLPAIAIVDWIMASGRGRAHWHAVAAALSYPLVWGGLTLARGSIVGWYPYFFLDPKLVDGFGEFSLFSGLALVLFGSVATGLVSLTRIRPVAERFDT